MRRAGVGDHAIAPWRIALRHRGLLYHLLRQEIATTYARSILGLYWLLLLPIFYVSVLVGVRFVAFGRAATEWVPEQIAPLDTAWSALAMVLGLIVFWLASEILARASTSVRKNSVFVTESNFPVSVLPWLTMGLALFNFTIRFLLFLLAYVLVLGVPPWEMLLLPFAVACMLPVLVGVAYLFSAVGVFVSDLEFAVQILMTALFLMSGILFPLIMVAEPYRTILFLNPVAFVVNEARMLGLDGQWPDWPGLILLLVVGLAAAGVGHAVFQRLQPRFSDAL